MNKERPKMKFAYEIVKSHLEEKDNAKPLTQNQYLKNHVKNLVEIEKMEYRFTKAFKRFLLVTKNDIFVFSEDLMRNFEWRNFTVLVVFLLI